MIGGGANGEQTIDRGDESFRLRILGLRANRIWAIAFGLIATLSIGFFFATNIYTNVLWFSHLGFTQVYTTILISKVILFLIGFFVTSTITMVSFGITYRCLWTIRPIRLILSTRPWSKRVIVVNLWFLIPLLSLIFGLALGGSWETYLLFVNRELFGFEDPVFNHDIGFYVFVLPMLHMVQGWLFGIGLTVFLISGAAYWIMYRVDGRSLFSSSRPRIHLSIMGSLLMVAISAGHFLDTYDTLFSPMGAVVGATATDISARIPVLRLMGSVAILAGIIMILSIWIKGSSAYVRFMLSAFSLWLLVALIGGLLVPSLYQRFSVTPNEFDREKSYIEENIRWTRYGFNLDGVQERAFEIRDDALARDIRANAETITNIRLWDPRPILGVYNQIQHLRLYYNFQDVDVDRYQVGDKYRQVIVGTREMFPQGLDDIAQNWVNRKLVYTHGFGIVMSPVTEWTQEGQPLFFIKDIPLSGIFEVDQPRIYYGESESDFVLVNSKEPQFDRPPERLGDPPVYMDRYDGAGGVPLSNILRRTAFSWELKDLNVLISDQITGETKVLYRRNVRERVREVAPFLYLDNDPYMVVDRGRLFWILDAYTTTDRLPYSKPIEPYNFNYVRNSVKVILDAYTGQLVFYTIEPNRPDPLLTAYKNMFPELFHPISEMPAGLREHIRYPEVLLRAQAEMFLQYHMTDAKEFFLKEDQWAVPDEIALSGNTQEVQPYYVIMKLPGEEREEFVMILPFTPKDKQNLVAWIAARSDGNHFGELFLYSFPTDRIFHGPSQIEARIDSDPVISEQFTLWGQSGSVVIRGNLLVIPIGESLIYAEPVYIQAETLEFPELKRVILATSERVVMEKSLAEAVAALLVGVDEPQNAGQDQLADDRVPYKLQVELDKVKRALENFREDLLSLEETLETLEELVEEER